MNRLITCAAIVAILTATTIEPAAAQNEDVPIPEFRRIVIDDDPPAAPYFKLVGDLSGNGRPEIVIAGKDGPIVAYTGPDWRKTSLTDAPFRGGVNGELADLDGDGRLDIVLGGVGWFQNPGRLDGDWQHHDVDNQRIHDVEVADLDGDGRLDLVCRDQSAFGKRGNAVFIYHQHETGTWRKTVFDCPHGEGLKVADIDADGRADIVIGGIWFQNTPGGWSEHAYAPDWTELDTKVETADLNGDGRVDIVVTPSELKGERYRVSWFEAPAGDITQPWTEHVLVPDIECVIHALALGDFNSDGTIDVAYAEMHQGADPDEVVVLLNKGQGRGWLAQVIDTAGSHDIRAADLDGDGDLDLVGANHSGVHPVVVWENRLR